MVSRFFSGLIVLVLLMCHTIRSDTSLCDESEKTKSYLDVAADMIARAKEHVPVCKASPTCKANPIDCEDLLQKGYNKSGIYAIWPRNRICDEESINVFCDMETEGGAWTVLQRRGNFNRQNDYFFKDWENYKKGFGDVDKDFWLGNNNIYALTNQRRYSLRFDMQAVDGEKRFALYDSFWIESEKDAFTLHISDYSGDAGDSMAKHDNQKFSTKDRDNDSHKEINCALNYKGGWWYNACHDSNLNGLYLGGVHESHANGVNWKHWKGHKESLEATEMKIRPRNFRRKTISQDGIHVLGEVNYEL